MKNFLWNISFAFCIRSHNEQIHNNNDIKCICITFNKNIFFLVSSSSFFAEHSTGSFNHVHCFVVLSADSCWLINHNYYPLINLSNCISDQGYFPMKYRRKKLSLKWKSQEHSVFSFYWSLHKISIKFNVEMQELLPNMHCWCISTLDFQNTRKMEEKI